MGIAIYELNTQNGKENNVWIVLESLAILFPIIDRLMASFMLYLQFKQTERVYLTLCSRLDDYVLLCGLKCVQWKLKKNNIKYDKDVNIRTLTTAKTENKDKSHLDIPNKEDSESAKHHSTHASSVTLSLPVSANLDAIVEEEHVHVETQETSLRLDMYASSTTYD